MKRTQFGKINRNYYYYCASVLNKTCERRSRAAAHDNAQSRVYNFQKNVPFRKHNPTTRSFHTIFTSHPEIISSSVRAQHQHIWNFAKCTSSLSHTDTDWCRSISVALFLTRDDDGQQHQQQKSQSNQRTARVYVFFLLQNTSAGAAEKNYNQTIINTACGGQ